MARYEFERGPTPRHSRAVRLDPARKPRVVRGARTCVHPNCGIPLSRYNPSNRCAVHGGWVDELTPDHEGS